MAESVLSNKLLNGRDFQKVLGCLVHQVPDRPEYVERTDAIERIVVSHDDPGSSLEVFAPDLEKPYWWEDFDPSRQKVLVSDLDGPFPVYASWDSSTCTVTLTSEADKLLMNEDPSHMFENLRSLRELHAQSLDSSCATNLDYVMHGCRNDEFRPDVSSWNVSKVRTMTGSFAECSGKNFNLDLSKWKTASLVEMDFTFDSCSGPSFNPKLEGLDVSNVESMICTFYRCSGESFNPNLSGWKPERLKDTNSMFFFCSGPAFKPGMSWLADIDPTKARDMFTGCFFDDSVFAVELARQIQVERRGPDAQDAFDYVFGARGVEYAPREDVASDELDAVAGRDVPVAEVGAGELSY